MVLSVNVLFSENPSGSILRQPRKIPGGKRTKSYDIDDSLYKFLEKIKNWLIHRKLEKFHRLVVDIIGL